MSRVVVIVAALLVAGTSAGCIVFDAAVTARNLITATLKQQLLEVQREQHRRLQSMARRLSLQTPLSKYALPDPPRWRTHGGDFLYAQPYNDALVFGDPTGVAYRALSQPLLAVTEILSQRPPRAQRELRTRLATIEATDATTIAGTHDTGQLRLNGRRRELPAIDALEAQVIDPSTEQSATAVLDKISGAVLLGARQRQARGQLLAGFVEQLVVDTKRSRDTDAAAMNMQLVTWRDGRVANEAFVAGTGEALGTWRQP